MELPSSVDGREHQRYSRRPTGLTHPYATEAYAKSLRHIGTCLPVPEWGCCVLIRPIFNGLSDCAGTYPFAVVSKDADLAGGLSRLRAYGLVSVVLVLDEIHHPELPMLNKNFTFIRPFKIHYTRCPATGPLVLGRHHRRALRRAGAATRVGVIDIAAHGADWNRLYAALIARHRLKGIHCFPPDHVNSLATLNGVTGIGAWIGSELVSAHIWVHHEGHVHSHLVASNEAGYAARAAYAVLAASVEHFRDASLINFGGMAGEADNQIDGLARFKSGFADGTAKSYICGAVLRSVEYSQLSASSDASCDTDFFPAYRAPGSIFASGSSGI